MRRAHGVSHFPHRGLDADKHRATHNRMADVQFLDLRYRRHRTYVAYGETVTGVHRQSHVRAQARRLPQRIDRSRIVRRVRVPTGVQLDGIRAEIARPSDGIAIRGDEQTGTDARAFQTVNARLQGARVPRDVQATLGRDLFAALGNECHLKGLERGSNAEHLLGQRHLEIEHRANGAREAAYVVILNVSTIFAQVGRDSVGTGTFAALRRGHRIRLLGASRLTDRGDMVDVDVQPLMGCSHLCPPVGSRSQVRRRLIVKRSIIAFVMALAACGPRTGGALTGAPAPRTAVEQFLAAVRAQDLQAMSVVWGSEKGPARDLIERKELEKRELVMQCMLTHDRFRILSEAPGTDGKRVFRVELQRGTLTRSTNFTSVQGPSDRWYVETADLEPVRDLCRQMPAD
jgi:hypothetical protein